MPKYLYIDFETRSLLDLVEVEIDRYCKHPSTEVLLMAYAFDDEEVSLWNGKGPIPPRVLEALRDPNVKKVAWFATFERNIFLHVLGIDIPINQWIDPSACAKYLSLPAGLEKCGTILGLTEDEAKMKIGKKLIHTFCYPFDLGGKKTLFGTSEPAFRDEEDKPLEWKQFEEYCKQDVRSERNIFKLMPPLPDKEQKLWELDQQINERGIPTNRSFVENCLEMARNDKNEQFEEMKEITGLENPNSRPQLLPWLNQHGYPFASLNKSFVNSALGRQDLPEICRKVLNLRKEVSKTAYIKFENIIDMLGDDDNLRFQFVFLGASRSGRWSGCGIQPQNLPRPIKYVEKNLEELIRLVSANDLAGLTRKLSEEKTPPAIVNVMTSLVRQSFQAPDGKKLVVCDLSAIENRVLGWVTGCDEILKVFRDGLDPYVAFAVKMYGLPYEILIKDKEKRQIAKPAVLGCGYGLGSGVERIEIEKDGITTYEYRAILIKDSYGNMIKTGLLGYAENMGISLTPEQAYKAHKTFRETYPEVCSFKAEAGWYAMERAAIRVLTKGGKVPVGPVVFDRLKRKNGSFILRILLPSGRYLHYMNAHVISRMAVSQRSGKEYEKKELYYDGIGHGVGQRTTGWGEVYTYGGKLMENIVQAISRDVLAYGMTLANERGGLIVLHVHDEICCLSDNKPEAFSLPDLEECMSKTPEWAVGLPLKAEGYEGKYYKK